MRSGLVSTNATRFIVNSTACRVFRGGRARDHDALLRRFPVDLGKADAELHKARLLVEPLLNVTDCANCTHP